ncbi:MAG: hypothetical protein U0359_25090 [Byssovorax sp.]
MLTPKVLGLFSAGALVIAGMLGGCVIVDSTSTGTTGSGGESSSTTSTGQGGEATGTGGSSTGTGGSGGTSCVGADGPHTVADCDTMNITPKTHGGGAAVSCGPNLDQEPPGYLACVHAFSVFTTGAASDLQDCLALIGVEDECTDEKWQACIDAMFKDACPSQDIDDACAAIGTTCGADPFDVAQCSGDLAPFNNDGLKLFQDCFNAHDMDPCQMAYDTCFTEVLTAQ